MRYAACLLLLGLIGLGWTQETPLPSPAATAAATAGPAAEAKPLFSDQEWTSSQTPIATTAETTSAGSAALTMLLGLVLVILMAIGLAWMVRRMQSRKLIGGRGRNLELLETVAIAPRRSVALVRCGNQWLVIGVGEKELVMVASMLAPANVTDGPVAVAPTAPPPPAQPSPFGNELSRLLGARTPPGERP